MPLSILIVEDYRSAAYCLMLHLRDAGHTVLLAHGADLACSLVETGQFDLLLCDTQLRHGFGGLAEAMASLHDPPLCVGLGSQPIVNQDEPTLHFYTTLPTPFDLGEIDLLISDIAETYSGSGGIPDLSPRINLGRVGIR